MRTSLKSSIWILGLLAIASLMLALWTYPSQPAANQNKQNSRQTQNTILIQSEIHGKVAKVFVRNNQNVKRGDILFEIDPIPYQIALEHAKAQLSQTQQHQKTHDFYVKEAKALLAQKEAELQRQETLWQRRSTLAKKGYISKDNLLEIASQVDAAKAAVLIAKAQLEKAQLQATRQEKDPNLVKAQANVDIAKLNLKRTKVIAPTDGIVLELQLYPDQVISEHQPLFYIKARAKALVSQPLMQSEPLRAFQ